LPLNPDSPRRRLDKRLLNDRKRKEHLVKESLPVWKTPVLQESKIPANDIASFRTSGDLKG